MKLSIRSRYAVEAMLDIARAHLMNRDRISLNEISSNNSISIGFLEQIFLDLKKSGLVKSYKGRQGGYALSKDIREISIFDIVNSVDGFNNLLVCTGKGINSCKDGNYCSSHKIWSDINNYLDSYLMKKNLSDYV